MKSSLFFKIIFATLTLALATGAFAANDVHKINFEISATTQVNGKQIPAGEYTAKWEGSGPTVQVSIMKGKNVVATVPGQIVELSTPALDTHAEVKNGANGDRELVGLQSSGKKYSLELGTEAAKAQSKADSAN